MWIKRKLQRIKSNFIYNFKFLKVLNSPFVTLKLKWYFGKIEHGTPYFLPRRWVKCNIKDADDAWNKLGYDTQKSYMKKSSKYEWKQNYIKSYTKPIPIKYFGYKFTSLGWKTKWDDYRFEWSPSISLVLFGKQIFIQILPKFQKYDPIRLDCYWEAWLNYENKTDKNKSKKERLKELVKIYSTTWISISKTNNEIKTDHYYYILKEKYLYDYACMEKE